MSSSSEFDFEKLVPGFEFLKNLGKTQSNGGFSSAANWVAPTLDPKELDRKIQELKTVQFWLDQNAKAIGATIQALEVQKMTLSTLRGMNFSMSDLSESLKANSNSWGQKSEVNNDANFAKKVKRNYSFTNPKKSEKESHSINTTSNSKLNSNDPIAAVDPAIWWNSLGEQFQQIAQKTVQEMQKHAKNNKHLHEQEVVTKASVKRSSNGAAKRARVIKPLKSGDTKGLDKTKHKVAK